MVPAPAYWLHWADSEVARVVRDGTDVLVHLGGGQAHAIGVIHGGQHVVGQLADARVHLGHGLGHGVQARIGVRKNG